jgi:hypothetical protein
VHADAPLQDPTKRSGAAYGEELAARFGQGFASIGSTLGLSGANALYALAARLLTENGPCLTLGIAEPGRNRRTVRRGRAGGSRSTADASTAPAVSADAVRT